MIGGYSIGDVFKNDKFFANDKNKPKTSFYIHDIGYIDSKEIMTIYGLNDKKCRTMKLEKEDTPYMVFDIIDTPSKTITHKSGLFPNGVGIGGNLFDLEFIKQWDIPPFDLVSRSFLFGDKKTLIDSILNFNIPISEELQHKLDLKAN